MGGLAREDGTAEPLSRDQLIRRGRRQGKRICFPVQLPTSRIGNQTRSNPTLLKVLARHAYILLVLLEEPTVLKKNMKVSKPSGQEVF